MTQPSMDLGTAHGRTSDILTEIEGAVVGDRSLFEEVLLGILSRGHVLMEDVPGTGKTLTARTFATALSLSFSRIQFTPDLLPADVTGSHVYNEEAGRFEFVPGPIFANVVLADEINRAPPKTQAAMLEGMEEGQVTVEDETHQLPDPFMVIATQNPIEQEGTFPLPEAQLDRFLVKTAMGYPDTDGYAELLRRRAGRETRSPSVEPVLEEGEIEAIQGVVERSVYVEDDVLEYIAAIATQTGQDRRVRVGISPRGAQRLFEASRSWAVLRCRDFVTPDDIRTVAEPVLAHRLVLTAESQVQNVDKRAVMRDVLSTVPVPTVE